ncbi:MAG: polyamine aminopropyltransferase [Buchnera aphidicola (Eriosoma harunire)]
MNTIIHEKLHPCLGQYFLINKILYEQTNEHQKILIFNNTTMGNILLLDDIIQTTEKDEFIYHEMITHVPIFTHPNPKKILIIGGGDGGVLREVIKHKQINKIVMVEIDRIVIDICKKFFPAHNNNAFNDPRLQLIINNGFEFIKKNTEKFDIIISDSTDPVGPGKTLFNLSFYNYCKKSLHDNGIFVAQNGVSFLQQNEIQKTHQKLKKIFHTVKFYQTCIPTYYGGMMTFSFSSNTKYQNNMYDLKLKNRIQSKNIYCLHYNYNIHCSSFSLPKYFLNILSHNN